MLDFERELGKAVKHFWQVRGKQKKRQGGKTGKKDAGERSSVTGGKHADGFISLIAAIVKDAALPDVEIHVTEKRPRTLPGFSITAVGRSTPKREGDGPDIARARAEGPRCRSCSRHGSSVRLSVSPNRVFSLGNLRKFDLVSLISGLRNRIYHAPAGVYQPRQQRP